MILTKSKIYEINLITSELKDILSIFDLCRFFKKINLTTRKATYDYNKISGYTNSLEKNYYKLAKYYGSYLESINKLYFMNIITVAVITGNFKLIDTLYNSYSEFIPLIREFCKNLGNKALREYEI